MQLPIAVVSGKALSTWTSAIKPHQQVNSNEVSLPCGIRFAARFFAFDVFAAFSQSWFLGLNLHVRVVRPFSPLRHNPGDVLSRVLDITGFAVHAVLRVDL